MGIASPPAARKDAAEAVHPVDRYDTAGASLRDTTFARRGAAPLKLLALQYGGAPTFGPPRAFGERPNT